MSNGASGAVSAISSLLQAIGSATSSTGVANVIGKHLQQQNAMQTSVKALIALATPENATQIATQIAALPGVPSTITVLLTELSQAHDQPTITAIGLQIEASLSANSGALGGILSAL